MKTILEVYNKVLHEFGYDKLQENVFVKGAQHVRLEPETNDQELAESIASAMPGPMQDNVLEVFFRIKTFRQRLTS